MTSYARTGAALGIAQARYWLTVYPCVREELRRWMVRARAIEDPVLRAHAVTELHNKRTNTEGIATLCTLAPREHRRAVVKASVALQVMYDYIDTVTEQRVDDQMRAGRQLFRAFTVALSPGESPVDYYRYYPWGSDTGYLDSLAETSQSSIADLPALAEVLPIARETVRRFGEAQVRSHLVPTTGALQLEAWAQRPGHVLGMKWWEWAGGAAASVLAVHALLSAATDPRTCRIQAAQIDAAYLLHSTLATMLDSLIDEADDIDENATATSPTTPIATLQRTGS